MNISECQDKLVKAYNLPKNTTEKALQDFFLKVQVGVASIQLFGNVAYILFEESVDPDTFEMLDGEQFLSGKINIKHASLFDVQDEEEFKQNSPQLNLSGFEVIDKNDDMKKQITQQKIQKEEEEKQNKEREQKALKIKQEQEQKQQEQERLQKEQDLQKQNKSREDSEKENQEKRIRNEKSAREANEKLEKQLLEKAAQDKREQQNRQKDQENKDKENRKQMATEAQAKVEQGLQRSQNQDESIQKVSQSSSPQKADTESGHLLLKAEYWALVGGIYIVSQLFQAICGC